MSTIKLGEITTIKTGKLNANAASTNGIYPFFTCGKDVLKIDNYSYDCECVLVAGNGDLNIKYYNGKFDAYQRTYIVEAKDKNKVHTRYLYYFLDRYLETLRDLSIGGVIKYIKLENLTDAEIHLPSIERQLDIINILDKTTSLKSKRQETLTKLDSLIQSVFLDMFGDPANNDKQWKLEPFHWFASIDTNMTTDLETYANYPHIGIANIESGTGGIISYKTVAQDNLTSGKYIFTQDHIIYSKIRPNLNKVALPTFNGLCSADAYPLLVHKENTNRYFFSYLLRSDAFLKYILNLSNRTNIPKVNMEQLQGFVGIAPPLNLQNKFAEIYLKISKTRGIMEDSLQDINTLNSAVRHNVFAEVTA
jgi:type I restriction enzyme S subunit